MFEADVRLMAINGFVIFLFVIKTCRRCCGVYSVCTAIKKNAKHLQHGPFFTRAFTSHFEKFQMLKLCWLKDDRGRELNGFQMLLKNCSPIMHFGHDSSSGTQQKKNTVRLGHVKILNTIIYFTNFDKSFGVTNRVILSSDYIELTLFPYM